jgi:hypothetical protein
LNLIRVIPAEGTRRAIRSLLPPVAASPRENLSGGYHAGHCNADALRAAGHDYRRDARVRPARGRRPRTRARGGRPRARDYPRQHPPPQPTAHRDWQAVPHQSEREHRQLRAGRAPRERAGEAAHRRALGRGHGDGSLHRRRLGRHPHGDYRAVACARRNRACVPTADRGAQRRSRFASRTFWTSWSIRRGRAWTI